MSPRRLSLAPGLVFLASLAAAQAPRLAKVELEFDQTADFATFKSFSWKDTQVAADNPTVHSSVVWYVEGGLRKKGLEKKGEGDLQVRYYTSAEQRMEGTPSQADSTAAGAAGTLSSSVSFSRETRATLVLELYRASDGKLVWKAAAPVTRIDKAKLDREVQNAVQLLLAKYPPKPSS